METGNVIYHYKLSEEDERKFTTRKRLKSSAGGSKNTRGKSKNRKIISIPFLISFTYQMSSHTSAVKHFLSKDIQFHTRQYFGCPTITNNGQTCRSSFTTNRFTDQITGKSFDCNWYCLRNCSPEKLLPIFKNIPKYAMSNKGDNMIISNVSFEFKTMEEDIIIKINSVNEEWEWTDFKNFGRIPHPQILRQLQQQGLAPNGKRLIELANQLCKWLGSQAPEAEIQVQCMATLQMAREGKKQSQIKKLGFIGFDKPFFQPNNKWSNNGYAIVTPFLVLNQGKIMPTQ